MYLKLILENPLAATSEIHMAATGEIHKAAIIAINTVMARESKRMCFYPA